MKVALIGLGALGIEIGGVLLGAGHELSVYNRTAAKAAPLVQQGARLCATPLEAAEGAQVVLSVVFDDAAFEAVTFGSEGILAGLNDGAVHACLSTISLKMSARAQTEHERRGREYVGAPVFGLPEAARAARLIIVTGGLPSSVAKAQLIFATMGRATFSAGTDAANAVLFKLCGNFMIHSMAETYREAHAVLRQAGSDCIQFAAAMAELWESPMYRAYGERLVNNPQHLAGSALVIKDNRLLLEAAMDLSVALPVASLVRDGLHARATAT